MDTPVPCHVIRLQKPVVLRLLRRPRFEPRTFSEGYRQLAKLLPKMVVGFDKANPETHQWYLTPPKEDAWKFLEKHRLTRDLFFSLWENEEVEIQKKTKKGEWEDVFVYTTALQTKTGSDTSD